VPSGSHFDGKSALAVIFRLDRKICRARVYRGTSVVLKGCADKDPPVKPKDDDVAWPEDDDEGRAGPIMRAAARYRAPLIIPAPHVMIGTSWWVLISMKPRGRSMMKPAAGNALKKLQAAIVDAPSFRGEWR